MANMTKRTARKMGGHLREGEKVLAAVLVEPKGSYGLGGVAMVVAPTTARKALARRADRERDEAGGIAALFPGESAVLMVTDSRVLVAPSNGIRFGAPVIDMPRGGAVIRSVQRRGLAQRIDLVFSDGSSVLVDSNGLSPLKKLLESLGTAP